MDIRRGLVTSLCLLFGPIGQAEDRPENRIAEIVNKSGADADLIRKSTAPFAPTALDPVLVQAEWNLLVDELKPTLSEHGIDQLHLAVEWDNAPSNPPRLKSRIFCVTQPGVDRESAARAFAAGLGIDTKTMSSRLGFAAASDDLVPEQLKPRYWAGTKPILNTMQADFLALIQQNSPLLRKYNLSAKQRNLADGFEIISNWVHWQNTQKNAWYWCIFLKVEPTDNSFWYLTARIDVGRSNGRSIEKRYDTDTFIPAGLIAIKNASFNAHPSERLKGFADDLSVYKTDSVSALTTLAKQVFDECVKMLRR